MSNTERFGKEEKEALCRVIDSADKTLSYYSFSYKAEGGEVSKFEKEFARWLGRKYCVAVNSGTSALMVALRSVWGFTSVDVPAYTFIADAEAVNETRRKINFQDIDPQTYCMMEYDNNEYEPSAILPVHTLGNMVNPKLMREAKRDGKYVIEDCAQAIGSKWKGKRAGCFGDLAIFSFQGTKTISTGEGGMVATDSEELMERCRAISNHGDMYKHLYPEPKYKNLDGLQGFNFRMTEMQATVGRCQLKKVDRFVAHFKKNANLIFEMLPVGITPPFIPKDLEHGYFILCCLWEGKTELRNKFLEKLNHMRKKAGLFWKASKKVSPIGGVSAPPGNIVGAGYARPLYVYPLYRSYKRDCPNVEELIKRSVWIDLHRFTSEEKILKEMDLFNKCYMEIVGRF